MTATIHVIDFEGNRRLGISEFGVVTLHGSKITDTYFEICQRDFDQHLNFFLSLRRSGLLAAHSAQTEDSLLRHYWASPGQVPLFFSDKMTLSWGPWIDTKLVYRRLFPKLASYELNDLIAVFDLNTELTKVGSEFCQPQFRTFHHALFDSLATTLLIQNLQKFFSNVSPDTLIFLCSDDRKEGFLS
jgi:DNA polymerase III epsilon subunit-like protein